MFADVFVCGLWYTLFGGVLMEVQSEEHGCILRLYHTFISAALILVDVDELERQIRGTGNPLGVAFLDAVVESLDCIENPRNRELARASLLLGLWKVLTGSNYQPAFYRALENLSKTLPGLPYDRYCMDPARWTGNKGYRLYLEKRKAALEREKVKS